MLRKFENIQLVKDSNEMQKDSETDQKKFWKYVNKTRKNRKNISPVADIDGSLITNPDDVVKDWGQYFEQLFANDDTEQGYEENFKKQVKAKISQLSTENQMKEQKVLGKVIVINENEIRNACSKLKSGNGGGKDGLKNEHLKYMGQIATNALCTLFNSIIELE